MALKSELTLVEKNVVSHLRLELIKSVVKSVEEQEKARGRAKQRDLRRQISTSMYEIAQELSSAYSKGGARELMAKAKQLVDEAVKALKELGYELIDLSFVTTTPLAIGLRNPYTEPLEIAIAWDPYLNLPYIPASSLKGAVASLAWATGSKLYDLLSKRDEASPIVFLDAYPVDVYGEGGLLAVDIVNPHYREVEGSISEPESRPTPLRFLVVPKGVAFRVASGIARRWLAFRGQLDVKELESLIVQALSRGIGAKTSLGYGRFKSSGP